LQQILTDAIDSVLDVDAFNQELDRERQDAAALDVHRRRALAALGGIASADGDGTGEAQT
jgi:hypothetical protein